jgi:hypothetical protein
MLTCRDVVDLVREVRLMHCCGGRCIVVVVDVVVRRDDSPLHCSGGVSLVVLMKGDDRLAHGAVISFLW